jgi:SAM-dependent methyltransferase
MHNKAIGQWAILITIGKIRRYGILKSIEKITKKLEKKIIRKKIIHKHIENYKRIKKYIISKKGLEIGGPSGIFCANGYIPVYKIMGSLDGVNFSNNTIWTGKMENKEGFIIGDKRVGRLFITDTTDLSIVKNNMYNFVLSSNNIEHIANPMKALQQWLLKLKKNGILIIIAPRKESNFDHKREIVKFEHIMDDFHKNIEETDLTHLEEILQLHDLKMDPPAGTYEQFKTRSFDNYKNRCLHHHVFSLDVLEKMLKYFDLKIIQRDNIESDYIIIGQK